MESDTAPRTTISCTIQGGEGRSTCKGIDCSKSILFHKACKKYSCDGDLFRTCVMECVEIGKDSFSSSENVNQNNEAA